MNDKLKLPVLVSLVASIIITLVMWSGILSMTNSNPRCMDCFSDTQSGFPFVFMTKTSGGLAGNTSSDMNYLYLAADFVIIFAIIFAASYLLTNLLVQNKKSRK